MRKRWKENLYKLIAILIILSIAVGWALLSEAWERAAKAEAMDRRELHYDADDDFILIDTQEGLMGVYHGCDPLTHFWGDFRKIKPGVYEAAPCEDSLELWVDGKVIDEVWRIYLKEKECEYLIEHFKTGNPVLVY